MSSGRALSVVPENVGCMLRMPRKGGEREHAVNAVGRSVVPIRCIPGIGNSRTLLNG